MTSKHVAKYIASQLEEYEEGAACRTLITDDYILLNGHLHWTIWTV